MSEFRAERDPQSLRDFQQALIDRLSSPTAGDSAQSSRLALLAGGEHWLLRLDEAQEVVPPAPITAVPLAKAWYLGLSRVRGNLFSIIDFGAFVGGARGQQGAESRFVVLSERFRLSAALLVDRVVGLRSIADLQRIDPIDAQAPWASGLYQANDGIRWREISISALAQSSEFLQTGR